MTITINWQPQVHIPHGGGYEGEGTRARGRSRTSTHPRGAEIASGNLGLDRDQRRARKGPRDGRWGGTRSRLARWWGDGGHELASSHEHPFASPQHQVPKYLEYRVPRRDRTVTSIPSSRLSTQTYPKYLEYRSTSSTGYLGPGHRSARTRAVFHFAPQLIPFPKDSEIKRN